MAASPHTAALRTDGSREWMVLASLPPCHHALLIYPDFAQPLVHSHIHLHLHASASCFRAVRGSARGETVASSLQPTWSMHPMSLHKVFPLSHFLTPATPQCHLLTPVGLWGGHAGAGLASPSSVTPLPFGCIASSGS